MRSSTPLSPAGGVVIGRRAYSTAAVQVAQRFRWLDRARATAPRRRSPRVLTLASPAAGQPVMYAGLDNEGIARIPRSITSAVQQNSMGTSLSERTAMVGAAFLCAFEP